MYILQEEKESEDSDDNMELEVTGNGQLFYSIRSKVRETKGMYFTEVEQATTMAAQRGLSGRQKREISRGVRSGDRGGHPNEPPSCVQSSDQGPYLTNDVQKSGVSSVLELLHGRIADKGMSSRKSVST
ncbi:hypothetical protein AVEN_102012-1 [Araneus ventricosus]|uniref:Uncharacterized protein n=1 Tax=Araneus ventricosus TaxID=182803 RepID=A0A4Y2J215_ARAVE|nr:hypothetical protein AVEN_102012-1 [Araneus ventricosus]